MFLLICISFKPMQLESYGNPPVFCQQHFALQLPSFSQRFLRRGYPSQAHSTNQFCFLAFHQQKKRTFNICYTCPSSLNCGIHGFLKRLCTLLSTNTSESKQPHKAPITASTFLLCDTCSAAFVSRRENI